MVIYWLVLLKITISCWWLSIKHQWPADQPGPLDAPFRARAVRLRTAFCPLPFPESFHRARSQWPEADGYDYQLMVPGTSGGCLEGWCLLIKELVTSWFIDQCHSSVLLGIHWWLVDGWRWLIWGDNRWWMVGGSLIRLLPKYHRSQISIDI